jgi:large subunit ribosomal protein L20
MRVKTGYTRHRRHAKILKANKGMRGANHRLYKRAHEAYMHAGLYAYAGRKLRKQDLRRLWIIRINAALTGTNFNYSQFIHALKNKNIALDRKILADLAVSDPATFSTIAAAAT